jgi:predicted ferric reductase
MQLWWYVARASGLVAWALLTATVVWGLLLSTKLLGRKPAPAWLLDLHRFVGGATVLFTLVHLVAILLDSYVQFDLASVLVPFASNWSPVAVAWGIVAFYLLAAVEITSLLRRHMPNRIWRRVHYASFPLFAMATIHGVTAGSDTRTTFAVMVLASVVLGVGFLTVARVGRAAGLPVPARTRAQRI